MKRATLITMGTLFLCLLVAACSSGTEDTTTSSSTTVPATTTTTAATTSTEAVAADAGCVACHTDQATLQALAAEPVAVETLSEGEG